MPLRTSLHRKPSSGRWSGRNTKRREVLSVNMISLPLADFRHITHIGDGADSFGDLSFLKMGHSLLRKSSQSEQNIFLTCSPPPPPKPPRLNVDVDGAEASESPRPPPPRRREKCRSLPLLDSEEAEEEEAGKGDGDGHQSGSGVAPVPPNSAARRSLNSGRDEDSTDTRGQTVGQRREEDSGFSFSLDLGPSILHDVLQVMDKCQ